MTGRRKAGLLETMWAAFGVDPESVTREVFDESLRDVTDVELAVAVNEVVMSDTRPPTIARLREVVFQRRLRFADSFEAWDKVARIAHGHSPRRKCVDCAGFGTAIGGEAPCPVCKGIGDVPTDPHPTLDEPTRKALETIGGSWAVKTTDRPEVLRAQFMKAHEHHRAVAVRKANMISMGMLEPAAEWVAELGADVPRLEAGEES